MISGTIKGFFLLHVQLRIICALSHQTWLNNKVRYLQTTYLNQEQNPCVQIQKGHVVWPFVLVNINS